MKCGEIIEKLEKKYPLSMAESWDNPGLLAGRREKEVQKIYIALDATEQVIREAEKAGADLLLTHHPMVFSAIKKVNTDDFIGRRLVELIRSDISYYAMHTNYDVVTMGALAAEILGLCDTEIMEVTYDNAGRREGFGRTGNLPGRMTLSECGRHVKQAFGLDTVRIFGNPEQRVMRAAVLPGSGKSLVDAALRTGADVLISGDFGHHDGIDAVMKGLPVIDAGHYGIEKIFVSQMAGYIRETFEGLTVYTEKEENPFQVI
ncbi:Nif3-like dinuclear metal center hexameric protein [Lachnospiraceae bacterium 46-15]